MTPAIALWISIGLGGAAQIALKLAVGAPRHNGPTSGLVRWLSLLRSAWFWLYLISFALATGLWLLALSGMNISYAFPLLSLSYALVAFLARLFLKESVPLRRWIAIGVICCGVILIAHS